ncbi:serine hydrolase [Actinoplanes sp. NEAU-A12]|uniref:Serine hydrolase n=1 Tax=Actinoplanes sandaracinus TaxID=3045177 RepID=A0ABT6WRI6_9ACTN|nr:serine hydrolase [Actinoplanes sandaracinus]MDI6102314.1 serine hydrolase [Actinoplanes sandaracinus]
MRSIRVWFVAAVIAVIISGGALIVTGINAISEGSAAASLAADRATPPAASVTPAASATATPPAAAPPPSVPPAPAGAAAQEPAAAGWPDNVTALDAALRKLAGNTPDFSVAVLDRKTGHTYAYRGSVKFDTASIVKTQILACMLLKAQDAGRAPTSAEMALAKPMIRLSDNGATTSLYQKLGGKAAVTRSNKRLGLTQTVVNSRWGLTRTTAADQVRLLAALVDPKGPLNASSRQTAFSLMNTVDKAQDWGVPSVAKAGEITMVKNGWDTRTADGGLWAVNTIGRVTSKDGAVDVSVVVLSHNNKSMQSGITLVEKAAKLTRQHLRY